MLLVTSNFPPEVGGPAKFTSDFASWLEKEGLDYTVLTTTSEDNNLVSRSNKVFYISRKQNILKRMIQTSVAMWKLGKDKTALVNGLFYESLFAHFFFKFKFIAKVPSDIVWDRARNSGKTDLNVDQFQGREPGLYKVQRWLFTRSLSAAHMVIVPSEHLGGLVSAWGIAKEKITLIRNSQTIPINKSEFHPTVDVISVGRLISLKGNMELISVCSKLGYSLRIVGEGPEETKLRELALKLGGRVEFLGSLSSSEVLLQVNLSRVFVLNSSHEGSPNALIEAMAQGAVCVVRENPGTRELITDLKTGILVGDTRALAEALEMALTDTNLRNVVGNGAFSFAKDELNQNVNFRRILDICE